MYKRFAKPKLIKGVKIIEKKAYLPIGQMAKMNNISVQTLRYYERIGLISPHYIDPETGYRYYTIEQSSTLDIIKYLQSSGLRLNEIKDILTANRVEAEHLISLLQKRRKDVEQQMFECNMKLDIIDNLTDSLENYLQLPEMGTIVLEHFQRRTAFIYKGDVNYYDNPLVYEEGLMGLKEAMASFNLPYFYSSNPAAITRRRCLKPGQLYCNELIAYIDKLYTNNNVPTTEIPGGTYMCIYCDDVKDETTYVYRLLDYIQNHNMEIIGDCIEESISDIIAIRSNRNRLIMRIKIPVRFVRFD